MSARQSLYLNGRLLGSTNSPSLRTIALTPEDRFQCVRCLLFGLERVHHDKLRGAERGVLHNVRANAGTFVIGHQELTAGVVCTCTTFPGGHGYWASQDTLLAGIVARPHPPPMKLTTANGQITNNDTSLNVGAVQESIQLWLFGVPFQ